jgi:hypothetical protein
MDGGSKLFLQVADAGAQSAKRQSDGEEDEGDIQQGGVRYGPVSHCCTRMLPLLGSPMR